jgi:hypothetical protein
MTLSKVQSFLDEAFEFLRDQRKFNVTREDWQKFWKKFCVANMNAIQKSDLRVAKQELTNELNLNSNVSDDEKIQKLEQIFCCDPFDKEFVKKLVDVYQKRKELDPTQVNMDSYHNLIDYYQNHLPGQNNFFVTIFPELLCLIDRKLQTFYSILTKTINNYDLKDKFIELFRNLYNKFTGIFTAMVQPD